MPGAPKLVRIDLASDRVARVIPLDTSVAPQGSYMKDIRFSADGRSAFLTDSGTRGALIATLIADPRLRWPDSMAEGPDGSVYVTASRIQDNGWFNSGAQATLRTQLFRVTGAR